MEQDPVRVFVSVHFHRRFKFQKRRQLFIRSQNETLSVAAMCVSNPDCSPLKIDCRDPAQTPTRIMEIVGDDLPFTRT